MSEKERVTPQLSRRRWHIGEMHRNVFIVDAEEGVTREDLKKSEFWAHVASDMRQHDRIEVRAENGSYFAEYLILACSQTWAQVRELTFLNLDPVDTDAKQERLSNYLVKHRGTHLKHCVIRKSDNQIISEGHKTKLEAMLALKQHEQSVAA